MFDVYLFDGMRKLILWQKLSKLQKVKINNNNKKKMNNCNFQFYVKTHLQDVLNPVF